MALLRLAQTAATAATVLVGKTALQEVVHKMEPAVGADPTASSLPMTCSTAELRRRIEGLDNDISLQSENRDMLKIGFGEEVIAVTGLDALGHRNRDVRVFVFAFRADQDGLGFIIGGYGGHRHPDALAFHLHVFGQDGGVRRKGHGHMVSDHGRMNRRHCGQEATPALFREHGHDDDPALFEKSLGDQTGARGRARSDNILLGRQMLYQLSYTRRNHWTGWAPGGRYSGEKSASVFLANSCRI